MLLKETKINGAYIVQLEKIEDERGFFARAWCRREFKRAGLEAEIVQSNISYNARKGTLRGMHYQVEPHAEVKFVRCIRGAVFDVIVDLRQDSPTYCRWLGVELTSNNRDALHIPKGIAHGYQTLADKSEIFYQVSAYYNPSCERGVRWNDPAFGIQWPDPEAAIISGRDRTWPNYTR